MTEKKEKILSMQPGRELNMEVAKYVMGLVVTKDEIFGYMERQLSGEGSSIWGPLGDYSEDASIARLVVNKMIAKGYTAAEHWADFGGGKYTEAEAICKAALLAVLEERNFKEDSDRILKEALGNEEDDR